MKAYAEYFQLAKNKNFRRKTLLHFGDSIELIGSAVLINPGSAKPIGNPDTDLIKSFYLSNHNLNDIDCLSWKLFKPDPTMIQLSKIFNGSYIGEERELNGINQLFNCFYYIEQNLDKALMEYNPDSNFLFNEEKFFINRPVYFGWGNKGKSDPLRRIAFGIFNNYDHNITPIYDSNFDNNCFYHPGYVNRSSKKSQITKELLKGFEKLVN
mgnify:CR=1 FL=1